MPPAAKSPRVRRPAADAVLDGAVELARAAAEEVADSPAMVGEHLGSTIEGDRLVSHRFACAMRGYRGWRWTVTLARVPRGRTATVCEVELLPGEDALLPPAWVPWSERLRPGDVGPSDILPFVADDPRLEPGYVPTGDPEVDPVAIEELALARMRVLSPAGRDEAATRWHEGRHGPRSAGSLASAESCGSCGFVVPLQGSLGTVFGVCANEWSQDDGQVVSFGHGCGAHSETDAEPGPSDWPDADPRVDDMELELVSLLAEAAEAQAGPAAAEAPSGTPDDAAQDPAGTEDAAQDPAGTEDAAEHDDPASDPAEPEPDLPVDPDAAGPAVDDEGAHETPDQPSAADAE